MLDIPKYIYVVNTWESCNEFEYYEMAFSSARELVRFMESLSPKATVTKKTMYTYENEPHVHHISVKELHSDGTEVNFDISKIIINYGYIGTKYRRSY